MSLVFNSEVDLVAVGKSFDSGSRQSTQRFSQLANGALLKAVGAWPTRQPVALPSTPHPHADAAVRVAPAFARRDVNLVTGDGIKET